MEFSAVLFQKKLVNKSCFRACSDLSEREIVFIAQDFSALVIVSPLSGLSKADKSPWRAHITE